MIVVLQCILIHSYLHNSVFLILYKWIKLTLFSFISCSLTVNSNWQDSASSVHDIYHELIDAGIRVWMFRFSYSINLSTHSFLINRIHTLTLKSFHKYTTQSRCFIALPFRSYFHLFVFCCDI